MAEGANTPRTVGYGGGKQPASPCFTLEFPHPFLKALKPGLWDSLSFGNEPEFAEAPQVKSVLLWTSVFIDYVFAGAVNEKMYWYGSCFSARLKEALKESPYISLPVSPLKIFGHPSAHSRYDWRQKPQRHEILMWSMNTGGIRVERHAEIESLQRGKLALDCLFSLTHLMVSQPMGTIQPSAGTHAVC